MPYPDSADQLLQEERRKNFLCGGLVTEIQQISQGIVLAREAVERQTKQMLPADQAEIAPALQDMDLCVRYLSYIAENLADLTASGQGRLTPHWQPVELAWQYGQLVQLMNAGTAGPGRIAWSCTLAEGRFIQADEAWADKILLNLLVNALRYTGGPVRASLAEQEQCLILAVRDDGPGISPGIQAQLFHPFEAEPLPDGARHGVGLGLYLAREYSLAMSWQFDLQSGPEGTQVQLIIPLQPETQEGAAGPAALRSHTRDLALHTVQTKRVMAAASVLRL